MYVQYQYMVSALQCVCMSLQVWGRGGGEGVCLTVPMVRLCQTHTLQKYSSAKPSFQKLCYTKRTLDDKELVTVLVSGCFYRRIIYNRLWVLANNAIHGQCTLLLIFMAYIGLLKYIYIYFFLLIATATIRQSAKSRAHRAGKAGEGACNFRIP